MTAESVAVKMAGLSAVSAAILQTSTPGGGSMSSLLVPVVSAVIGGAMSYAMLQATVKRMERDVRDMRHDMSEIYTLLRDSMTKVAHIEGRLERSE